MKTWDKIIIAVLIVISFVPNVIFLINGGKNYDSTYAVISVNGKKYREIPLSTHKGNKEFIVKCKQGYNKILVQDNKIAIIDADCADKVCMGPGFIDKPGRTLVCLPHKLVVEIKGTSADTDDIDINSH